MTLEPIGPFDIILVSTEFVALVTLIGNPIRRMLLDSEAGGRTCAEVTWIFSLTTGVATLALLLLWIGLIPGSIVWPTTVVLVVATAAANIVLYRRKIGGWRQFSRYIKSLRMSRTGWFVALFLVISAVQMAPLVGLWVTPGDDAKLYSLISLRIIQSQGLPKDWGIFADPSWYTEHVHLLLPGFSSEVAFLNLLFGDQIPSTVSILSSLFRCVAPASVYAFAWTITRRRIPSLIAMGVYGLVIIEPTFGWFTWGGMAELSSLSVLPIAGAATYLLAHSRELSWRLLLWTTLLVAGMSMLHPFAFFYYLMFVIATSAIMLVRRKVSRGIIAWLPGVLSLALGAGPFANALIPELAISKSYSTSNPAWTPTLNLSMSILQAISSFQNRFFAVYGQAATAILLVGLVLTAGAVWLRDRFNSREIVGILGLWYLFLFFLHENNPNGLFVIPFPLWYRIDSNRTFGITSLVVSLAIGLIADNWTKTSHLARNLSQLTFKNMRSSFRHRWKSLLLVSLVLGLLSVQEITNVNVIFGARTNSPITTQDIAAFNWIQSHTPANATFFTNTADAGNWLPIYADRRVIMPFGVVTNNTLLAEYETESAAFSINPSDPSSLQFMHMTGATYVYCGPARINGRPGFDPAMIEATTLFLQLYHQEDVFIFRLK